MPASVRVASAMRSSNGSACATRRAIGQVPLRATWRSGSAGSIARNHSEHVGSSPVPRRGASIV